MTLSFTPPSRDILTGDTQHVVVIGAGLSGLTAAVRLAGAGHQVTVIERDDHVGGRAATQHMTTAHGQFSIDTGASVLTLPQLVYDTIATTDIAPQIEFTQLDPAYYALFASGRQLQVSPDPATMVNNVRDFAEEKGTDPHALASGYMAFRRWAEKLFAASFPRFVNADFDHVSDLFKDRASRKDLATIVRLGGMGSLAAAVESRIPDDEVARIFSFQALYAGVPPKQARAIYATIAHMDTSMGVYYPTKGGMGAVAEELARVAQAAGATVKLQTTALGVQTAVGPDGKRRISRLFTNDGPLKPDAVIATCELPTVEKLMGRSYDRTLTLSPSAVVIHGSVPTELSHRWPGDHHTISFGEAWEQTFVELTSQRGRLMGDPSLLITRPARTSPDMSATDGYEPMSILAPCPHLHSLDCDWDRIAPSYVSQILRVLERRGFTGIEENLAIGRIDTPKTWQAAGMIGGTPFAAAHTFKQTGPFRTRNTNHFGVANLVLAGSTTTPGVGVPTVMLSGALAARRITG